MLLKIQKLVRIPGNHTYGLKVRVLSVVLKLICTRQTNQQKIILKYQQVIQKNIEHKKKRQLRGEKRKRVAKEVTAQQRCLA